VQIGADKCRSFNFCTLKNPIRQRAFQGSGAGSAVILQMNE
jgi:hypothetical protein